jgi:hypothetical protein
MGSCFSSPRRNDADWDGTEQLPSLGWKRASDDRRLILQQDYEQRMESNDMSMSVRVFLCW